MTLKDLSTEQVARRIDILAKILMVLAGVTFISAGISMTGGSALSQKEQQQLFSAVIELLIGFGLLKRNIVAFYAFRVLGILTFVGICIAVLAGAAVIGMLSATINTQALSVISLFMVIGILASILSAFIWIYGLFLTGTKTARNLFKHTDQPQPVFSQNQANIGQAPLSPAGQNQPYANAPQSYSPQNQPYGSGSQQHDQNPMPSDQSNANNSPSDQRFQ